jgi:hypothetical protein
MHPMLVVTVTKTRSKIQRLRAFWDPCQQQFISRLGNLFTTPKSLRGAMPRNASIDGELFAGRGRFTEAISIVKKRAVIPNEWRRLEYHASFNCTIKSIYIHIMTDLRYSLDGSPSL